ncbi:MAG TPA: ricin-type beta-trefoil lectin domain protein [Longimicrobium sp.]|nr:ricin-type beta-trefoil lectin domain protein [Longimicrobium sp.]
MRVSSIHRRSLLAAGVVLLAACTDQSPTTPAPRAESAPPALSVAGAYGTGQPYQYHSRVAEDRCMDVAGASREYGAAMTIWHCLWNPQDPAPQQTFTWTAAGELKVYAGTPDERCLSVENRAITTDGAAVITWGCIGAPNQYWEPGPNGTDIRVRGTTKCLDIPGGDTTVGTRLIIWECHGASNQQWDTGASPPAPATNPVLGLVGPAIPVSTVEGWGGAFARYEQDFRTFAEQHWANDGAWWEAANYYDRAKIYYVWWARTGNQAYRDRADALALNYRTNYVEANNYGVSAHWSQIEGIALHYLLTGDEASRVAVGRMADNFAVPYYMNGLNDLNAEMENRMQARTLLAFVIAHQIGAPRGDYPADKPTWEGLAREALTKILASQGADGAYRFQHPGINQCGHNKPFMVGLLNDALIHYYQKFEADPRILPAVKKSVDYLWANDWRDAQQAFDYLGGPCGGDTGTEGAPDLNNLVVNGFGWVYQQTGDATYRTRGDAVFAGGVNGAWLHGGKQFNENYTSSYKYLAYR